MSKKKGFGKLLTGIAIGTGLGLLFAPKSGKETRKDLKEKLERVDLKMPAINELAKNLEASQPGESKKLKAIPVKIVELEKKYRYEQNYQLILN